MPLEALGNTLRGRRYQVEREGGGCVARLRTRSAAVRLAEGIARESPPEEGWCVVLRRRRGRCRVVWRSGDGGLEGQAALVPLEPPRGPLRSDSVALELPHDDEPPDAVSAAG